MDRRGSPRTGRRDRGRTAVPGPAAKAHLSARSTAVLAAAALGVGVAIALVDSSPGWDDTGITAGLLLVGAGIVAAIAGERPWLWAALVGLPTPVLELTSSGNAASVLAVAFAAIGAAAGWLVSPRRR
jgi:hypothetical protein